MRVDIPRKRAPNRFLRAARVNLFARNRIIVLNIRTLGRLFRIPSRARVGPGRLLVSRETHLRKRHF